MPPSPSSEASSAGTAPTGGFWRRRIIAPLRTQLTRGVSPRALSHAVAGGFVCGVFPVLGTTTLLTTVSGIALRLNQPVMQSINWLTYPLHLVLIPVFIRLGEHLFGAEPLAFSIPQLVEIFAEAPAAFFSRFAMTFAHCIVAWLVVAPFLAVAIVLVIHPVLRRAAERWQLRPSSPATR